MLSLAAPARRALLPHARAMSTRLGELRAARADEIAALVEVQQCEAMCAALAAGAAPAGRPDAAWPEDAMLVLESGMATQLLHTEARVASLLGEGFYTIGPCGEELLGGIALSLRPTDAVALHYRHVATQVVRQRMAGRSLEEVALDRARGFVTSALDPVTGGGHCAIGGGEYDFLVTSTLASQTPPAVGRALAPTLAYNLGVDAKMPRDAVSFVSVGDGSVNNAHFLAGANMAQYAKHRGYKCPIVFGISDNDRCISLRGHNWLGEFLGRLQMPTFRADGDSLAGVAAAAEEAIAVARRKQRPVALVVSDLPRRFGHAATDRQGAYLSADEIAAAADNNPLLRACAEAVRQGAATYEELSAMYERVRGVVVDAFDAAAEEPKISDRQTLLDRVSQPLVGVDEARAALALAKAGQEEKPKPKRRRKQVMRKAMTQVVDEMLETYPQMVYIGEDVEHGGYYLVTDGLAKKHPYRVRDFPPDETSLIGAGMGFAQAGLLPVVEIPYAKYLDCGADMFFEAAISNWLSNGQQPNGMIIRLQGFGKGVFGGNFHTHNSLHLPPGIDVVCYSNGPDYARGFRYCVQQALAGRVVMTVDSTNLLNNRHVHDRDDKWQLPYPDDATDVLGFDEVTRYGRGGKLAIVTYGNGVVTALQAKKALADDHGVKGVSVIDCPLLSDVPQGLKDLLPGFDAVLFVDVCKEGQHPFASFVTRLHREQLLPERWECIAEQRTYNPLGCTLTFTSVEDIVEAAVGL